MTGVPVLSSLEFFQREADQEHRDVAKVIDDFYSEMDDANREDTERLRSEALPILQDVIAQNPEVFNFDIVAVERVEEADSCSNFRSCHAKLLAIVICDDGKRQRAIYTDNYYSGTMWEPPDGDTELVLEGIDGDD